MREVVTALLFAAVLSGASHAAENPGARPPATKITPPPRPLDLKTADIRRLFTPKQIAASLSGGDIQKVEVIGSPVLVPQTDSELPMPWAGPAGIVYAFLHPAHAWRILAPVLPDQAAQLNGRPDLDGEMFRLVTQ